MPRTPEDKQPLTLEEQKKGSWIEIGISVVMLLAGLVVIYSGGNYLISSGLTTVSTFIMVSGVSRLMRVRQAIKKESDEVK